MMPKKNRHNLTVDGVLYHYIANIKWKHRVGNSGHVVIQNTTNNELTKVIVSDEYWKKYYSVKPAHVKAMIKAGKDSANFMNYLEPKTCGCGKPGDPVKHMCVFDAEIRHKDPHRCNCCIRQCAAVYLMFMTEKLNDWIYIYFIKDDLLLYDRTVSRNGLGPSRAKQRVEELNALGHEAFYTIGTLARMEALS